MPDPAALGLFVVACMVLLLTPGPAVLYIIARGIDHGRGAALVSVAGIHVGTLAHVLAAAVGLSALLAASATAFTAVKWAGAAYLVWLGVQRLRADDAPGPIDGRDQLTSLRRVFWQGVVVNVLNPKTAVFFLAFLPQFADRSRGPLAPQLVVLGLVFLVLGIVSDGLYAVASGSVGRLLAGRSNAARASRLLTGGTYVVLGVTTAAVGGSRT